MIFQIIVLPNKNQSLAGQKACYPCLDAHVFQHTVHKSHNDTIMTFYFNYEHKYHFDNYQNKGL